MTFPADFTYPVEKVRVAALAAAMIAGLVADRRVVVQAGGCIGLWPLALAQYFETVYTFEPQPDNFACLRANVAAMPNVIASPVALGAGARQVGLARHKPHAGLWRVDGDGPIPMVALDDVLEGPVDALVLDVEGSELEAWRGAARVMATSRPVLWFEAIQHADALAAYVQAQGYTAPAPALGGDAYSVHASRRL